MQSEVKYMWCKELDGGLPLLIEPKKALWTSLIMETEVCTGTVLQRNLHAQGRA